MKYSFCSITYGSAGSWVPAYTLQETIRRVSRVGYDALEVVTASPHAWPYYLNNEKRAAVAQQFRDASLRVSNIMPHMSGGPGYNVATENDKERAWTVEYLMECVDLAKAWEAGSIAYLAGWTLYGCDKRTAWKNSLESLRSVASYAEKKGVRVLVYPALSKSNVVDSPEDARQMMEEAGVGNIGLMFDVMSAVWYKQDPADYVYSMGKNLEAIHVCDYGRQVPGTAGLDFKQLFLALRGIGYGGYVTVEVDASRAVHADAVARRSLEYLRNLEASL